MKNDRQKRWTVLFAGAERFVVKNDAVFDRRA